MIIAFSSDSTGTHDPRHFLNADLSMPPLLCGHGRRPTLVVRVGGFIAGNSQPGGALKTRRPNPHGRRRRGPIESRAYHVGNAAGLA